VHATDQVVERDSGSIRSARGWSNEDRAERMPVARLITNGFLDEIEGAVRVALPGKGFAVIFTSADPAVEGGIQLAVWVSVSIIISQTCSKCAKVTYCSSISAGSPWSLHHWRMSLRRSSGEMLCDIAGEYRIACGIDGRVFRGS
jgi:hypothetical protein